MGFPDGASGKDPKGGDLRASLCPWPVPCWPCSATFSVGSEICSVPMETIYQQKAKTLSRQRNLESCIWVTQHRREDILITPSPDRSENFSCAYQSITSGLLINDQLFNCLSTWHMSDGATMIVSIFLCLCKFQGVQGDGLSAYTKGIKDFHRSWSGSLAKRRLCLGPAGVINCTSLSAASFWGSLSPRMRGYNNPTCNNEI